MLKKALRRSNRNERGYAMLLTLLVLALGMVVIPASLAFIGTGTMVQERQKTRTAQLYAADAGAEHGLWWVMKADHESDPLPEDAGDYKKLDPVTLGGNNVQTYITYLGETDGADRYRVQAYSGPNVLSNASPADAQPSPYTLATAEVSFTVTSMPLFANAIGSLNGGITIGNNAIISCTPAPPPYTGNVAANGGSIAVGANANVYGDARATGTVTKGANANIAGTTTPNADPTTFESVDTAPYLAETQFSQPGATAVASTYNGGGTISGSITLTGNLNIGNNKTVTVNGDLYMLNGSITFGNNAKLIVNGRTYVKAGSITGGNNVEISFGGTVYVSGNLTTGNNAPLIIGGTMWVGGAATFSNNNSIAGAYTVVANNNISFSNNSGVVGTSQIPLFISNNGSFSFGNNVNMCAFLYAPNGSITLSNNAIVKGAIVARSATVSNNCQVTYVTEQRAGLPGGDTDSTSSVLSWEISQN